MSARTKTLRAWAAWAEDDYHSLVRDLRNGIDLETAAANLGRTTGAITKRLTYFIPPEEDVEVTDREQWVRDRIARPRWDWLAVVRDHQHHNREELWSLADTRTAVQAWNNQTPIAELARTLSTSEISAARLLVHLGLAENRTEVIARLGATPGAALARREEMTLDRTAGAIWVLVIDGAAGTSSPHGLGFPREITIHTDPEEAEKERDRVIAWHNRARRGDTEPVIWSITERSLGNHVIGQSRHGQHPPAAKTSTSAPARPRRRRSPRRRSK
uniref:hypothetical protein n=1 Tax=Nocardia suismassiliense TaxID=2077092 RepID=UPI003F4984C6